MSQQRSRFFAKSRSGAVLGAALGITFAAAGFGACSKTEAPVGDRPAGLPPLPRTLTATPPPAPPAAPPGAMPVAPPGAMPAAPELAPAPASAATIDPRRAITGTLELPFGRRGDVGKGDVLFLIARRPSPDGKAQGTLVASKKLEAMHFPTPFVLSAEDVMMAGTPFEGVLVLTARVDKDGDPMTRRKGDVVGVVKDVKVGAQGVTIKLDTVLTEDQTLPGMPPAGGMAPGAGLPAGHPLPPGHGNLAPPHP